MTREAARRAAIAVALDCLLWLPILVLPIRLDPGPAYLLLAYFLMVFAPAVAGAASSYPALLVDEMKRAAMAAAFVGTAVVWIVALMVNRPSEVPLTWLVLMPAVYAAVSAFMSWAALEMAPMRQWGTRVPPGV